VTAQRPDVFDERHCGSLISYVAPARRPRGTL